MKVGLAAMLGLAASWPALHAQPVNDPASLNPLSSLGPEATADFLERPLFARSRSVTPPPAAKPAASDGSQAAPAEDIRLIGIVDTPKGAIARVAEINGDRKYSVRTGDYIGEWAVVSVDASTLRMSRNGEVRTLGRLRQGDAEPKISTGTEDAPSPDRKVRSIEPRWNADDLTGFFGDRKK